MRQAANTMLAWFIKGLCIGAGIGIAVEVLRHALGTM